MVISTPVRSFSGQQSCQSRHYTDVLETEQPPPAKRGRVTPLGVHCGADVDFSEHDGSSETKQDVSTEAAVVTPVPPVTFTSTSTTGSGGRSRQPSPERAKVRLLEDHTGLCDHGGDRGVGMTPAAVFACVSPSQPTAGGDGAKAFVQPDNINEPADCSSRSMPNAEAAGLLPRCLGGLSGSPEHVLMGRADTTAVR